MSSLMLCLEVSISAIFEKRVTDLRTDPRTDGQTDKASYRDAWTHLKRKSKFEANMFRVDLLAVPFVKDHGSLQTNRFAFTFHFLNLLALPTINYRSTGHQNRVRGDIREASGDESTSKRYPRQIFRSSSNGESRSTPAEGSGRVRGPASRKRGGN